MPAHSQTSSLRSRVVPCVSCTTAARVEVSRLIERRLADVREADDRDRAEQQVVVALRSRRSLRRRRSRSRGVPIGAPVGGTSSRGRPRACTPASQSKSTRMRRSISSERLLVAAAALRQALEQDRLADGDRARREVAELPELRAVDRDRHDRHALLDRDHRRAGLRLARARRCRWRVPSTKMPSARPSRTASRISRTASRSDSPRRTASVPCQRMSWPSPGTRAPRPSRRSRFRGESAPTSGDVDPGEVVDREHAAALARDPLEAVAAPAREERA